MVNCMRVNIECHGVSLCSPVSAVSSLENASAVDQSSDNKAVLCLEQDDQAWTMARLLNHLQQTYMDGKNRLIHGGRLQRKMYVWVCGIDYKILGAKNYRVKDGDSILLLC